MTSNTDTDFVSIDIALTNEELEFEKFLNKKAKIQLRGSLLSNSCKNYGRQNGIFHMSGNEESASVFD